MCTLDKKTKEDLQEIISIWGKFPLCHDDNALKIQNLCAYDLSKYIERLEKEPMKAEFNCEIDEDRWFEFPLVRQSEDTLFIIRNLNGEFIQMRKLGNYEFQIKDGKTGILSYFETFNDAMDFVRNLVEFLDKAGCD